MDLPSCPSCRQSVLDDDAEVCPFCGAPMKGGSAAPAGRPVARPATAAPRPATRPETKGPSSAGLKPSLPAGAAAPPAKSAKAGAAMSQAAPSGPSAAKVAPGKSVAARATTNPSLDAKPAPSPPGGATGLFDEGGDPLDVKTTLGRNAIPASKQKTKSRPHKITCPMCETVGYIPQSAAGKEV
ncbi:MAG TPA: hypothetical protein VGP63_17845, partial [Planctomycetaceae bacterium]|nr:hypothetical protein [Planctomycetaceae bacterium]